MAFSYIIKTQVPIQKTTLIDEVNMYVKILKVCHKETQIGLAYKTCVDPIKRMTSQKVDAHHANEKRNFLICPHHCVPRASPPIFFESLSCFISLIMY